MILIIIAALFMVAERIHRLKSTNRVELPHKSLKWISSCRHVFPLTWVAIIPIRLSRRCGKALWWDTPGPPAEVEVRHRSPIWGKQRHRAGRGQSHNCVDFKENKRVSAAVDLAKTTLRETEKNGNNFPTRQLLLGKASKGWDNKQVFLSPVALAQRLTGSSHSSSSRSIKHRRAGRWCSADPRLY